MSDETKAVEDAKEILAVEDTMEEVKKRPAEEINPDVDEPAVREEEAEGLEVDEDEEPHDSAEVEKPASDHNKPATTGDIAPVTTNANLPDRPIKKARTAYFIFADEKRPEIQKRHPGEPIGIIARETGQLWAKLDETAKAVYHAKSAEERERVSQELAKYKLDGVDFGLPPTSARDLNTLVFPLARLRKITKLDPDVKGLSKEALLLITKCAEMVTTKLGQETVKVAQLQNRRKLLPEDVAQVCATREQFLFLREDVKDLMKEQHLHNKKALEKKKGEVATVSAKPFADFFASK